MKATKILIAFICVVLVFLSMNINMLISYGAVVEPQENQKVEYRAVSMEPTDNGKQLIVEIWIHNLNFKGIDIRLAYDPELLKTSNLETNQIIDVSEENGIPSCFQFSNEFGNYLDYMALEKQQGEYRAIMSILGEDERTGSNEYLVEDENLGDYVSIKGEVLLGRMSFNVGNANVQDITKGTLLLKEASTSPTTGIKVNINGVDSYENKKLFEFTLDLQSNNAYLINIESDSFVIEDFDKEKFNYEVILNDEKDVINITPTPEDVNSKITYNGEVVENGKPFEVELNPVGIDTNVSLVVTSEDGEAQNTYTVVIKRPGGTIEGAILTSSAKEGEDGRENDLGQKIIHTADIKIYQSDLVDWNMIASREELEEYEEVKTVKTNNDGAFSIGLASGKYDLLVDKPGYLHYVIKDITITDKGYIDLGDITIIAGDVTKDGMVDLIDMTTLNDNYGAVDGLNDNYNINIDYTEDGIVDLIDMTILNDNYGQLKTIINYEEGGF